jgi:hypothetical protein
VSGVGGFGCTEGIFAFRPVRSHVRFRTLFPGGRPEERSRECREACPRPRRGGTGPRGAASSGCPDRAPNGSVEGGESIRRDRLRPRVPYRTGPGPGTCLRQASGKTRTGRGEGPRHAPGAGRTGICAPWFRWEGRGWSRAFHRAGVMAARERQGDRESGNDTPFATEKSTSGRSCVVSRGIAGGFSGIVYVG